MHAILQKQKFAGKINAFFRSRDTLGYTIYLIKICRFLFFRKVVKRRNKEIEFLPQTKIFWYQYLRNLMVQTINISNYSNINSLKYLRSTTLGYKDIEIRKSEFVANTQLLYLSIFYLRLFNSPSFLRWDYMNPEV